MSSDFDTSRILSFISIQFFTISVSAVCAEVVGIREVFVTSTHNAVELQIYTLKLKIIAKAGWPRNVL